MTLRQTTLVRSVMLLVLAGILAACSGSASAPGEHRFYIQPTPGPLNGGAQR